MDTILEKKLNVGAYILQQKIGNFENSRKVTAPSAPSRTMRK